MRVKGRILKAAKARKKMNFREKAAVKSPALSMAVKEQMEHFIEYHPAKRLSKNLRRMLLEFLQTENGVEALYLNDLLYDLDGLFNLLEVIQTEEELRQISGGNTNCGGPHLLVWKNQEIFKEATVS